MKIKKMSASYGTLQNSSLELDSGLNIVYAPNESGKSTWCSFIRAMLYGIDTTEREKGGIKPDKVKYLPWHGSPMEGSMELNHRGRDITINRWTKSANAPMREFSAVYTGTSEQVKEIRGSDAGEILTGVPKAVFERSAFVKQSAIGVNGNPELEKRITAIVSTGEEDTSFTEADEQLRAWQRKRRYGKRGALPELEESIADVRRKLRDQKISVKERADLEENLERALLGRDELFKEMEESRKRQRRDALDRLTASQNRHREMQHSSEEAKDTAFVAKTQLAHSKFGMKDPDAVWEEVKKDADRAAFLRTEADRKISHAFWIIPAALCIISLLIGIWYLPFLIVGGFFLVITGMLAIRIADDIKNKNIARESRRIILSKYSLSNEEDMLDSADYHRQLWDAWQKAEQNAKEALEQLEAYKEKQKEMEPELLENLDFVAGDSEAAYLTRRLSAADDEIRRIRDNVSIITGRIEAQGDPMVLETLLNNLEARYARLTEEFDAINLAVETLREAGTEIQNRFSPRLSRRATELMRSLTGGRYDELALDRQFSASARRSGDTISHDAAFLSDGALDQLYLALRLSICELALDSDEPCPIILDDSLVNFDDKRMALALELLLELSETRQIILFTCHKREAEYFEKKRESRVSICSL